MIQYNEAGNGPEKSSNNDKGGKETDVQRKAKEAIYVLLA